MSESVRGLMGVAVAAALLLLAGCSGSEVASGEGTGFVGGSGASEVITAADRAPAPDVAGTTLDGDQLSLAEFAGDVVVVNVWGSWCAPCRSEAPVLQEVFEDNADRGVQFVGLNTRDQQAAAQAFERRFGITYPSLVDDGGELQLAFRDSLPPNAIPSTLVIDREGRIAARVVGEVTYTQLSEIVDELATEA